MIKAKPITENSWILFNKLERCGLMRKLDVGYVVIGGSAFGEYDEIKTLEEIIGKITFEKLKINVEHEKLILDDFPVKHDSVFEKEIVDNIHLYTKIEGSKDVYAAGYFSVKSKDKWQTVFCPRYKTIENNEFHGPYKSKMEADHETKMENNK